MKNLILALITTSALSAASFAQIAFDGSFDSLTPAPVIPNLTGGNLVGQDSWGISFASAPGPAYVADGTNIALPAGMSGNAAYFDGASGANKTFASYNNYNVAFPDGIHTLSMDVQIGASTGDSTEFFIGFVNGGFFGGDFIAVKPGDNAGTGLIGGAVEINANGAGSAVDGLAAVQALEGGPVFGLDIVFSTIGGLSTGNIELLINGSSFHSAPAKGSAVDGIRIIAANQDTFVDNISLTTIPEPSALALLGLGGLALALIRRRR